MSYANDVENPVGLDGIEFLEFATPDPAKLEKVFFSFGFSKIGQHKSKNVQLYRQGDINFVINNEANSFAYDFKTKHGSSICAMALRTKIPAEKALEIAVSRGARKYENQQGDAGNFPAIYGIGDCVVYFIDQYSDKTYSKDFEYTGPKEVKGYGFTVIDHMTNNVPKNQMDQWCEFYENVFNFKEKRYFDIKGKKTGLISKVMVSPCGKFSIPINEPTDDKSQIQEYIEEYKGSGIQHVALLTDKIIPSVSSVQKNGVEFLDAPDTYYGMLDSRGLGYVKEDVNQLKDLSILVDGDEKGYLLQIFTKNLCGPIFFEVIDRKGHDGFGDGNFQALFDAIEKDQQVRGVL